MQVFPSSRASVLQATVGDPQDDNRVTFLAHKLVHWWNRPVLQPKFALALLFALVVAICVDRAFIGLSAMKMATQDAFTILDGAWRTMHGQRPHLDFYSGLGPVTYLLCAAGITLAHGSQGYGWAQAFFGLIAAVWAFLIAKPRLSHVATALLTILIALLAVAPINFGDLPRDLSPDMIYNRYGYALVAIVMIEALCRTRTEKGTSDFIGGFSSGAILAILLFLKITFFLACGAVLLMFFPWRRQTKQRWIGAALAFLLFFIPFFVYLKFNLAPMLNDLRMIGAARHFNVARIVWYLLLTLERNILPFVFFLSGVFALLWSRQEAPLTRRILPFALLVCGLGVFLILTNAQTSGLPLDIVFAVVLFDSLMLRLSSDNSGINGSSRGLALLWMTAAGLILVSVPMLYDSLALADGLFERVQLARGTADYRHFVEAPNFTEFRSFENETVDLFNSGARLLKQYRRPSETVAVLNQNNPYSYALGIKPPDGGVAWLQFNIDYDYVHRPSPEQVMRNADLVLLPKEYKLPSDNDNIPIIYGPYLREHFTQIGESKMWWLFRHHG